MLSRLARSCIVRERLLAASPGAAALRFERRAGGILRGTARARLEGEVFFGVASTAYRRAVTVSIQILILSIKDILTMYGPRQLSICAAHINPYITNNSIEKFTVTKKEMLKIRIPDDYQERYEYIECMVHYIFTRTSSTGMSENFSFTLERTLDTTDSVALNMLGSHIGAMNRKKRKEFFKNVKFNQTWSSITAFKVLKMNEYTLLKLTDNNLNEYILPLWSTLQNDELQQIRNNLRSHFHKELNTDFMVTKKEKLKIKIPDDYEERDVECIVRYIFTRTSSTGMSENFSFTLERTLDTTHFVESNMLAHHIRAMNREKRREFFNNVNFTRTWSSITAFEVVNKDDCTLLMLTNSKKYIMPLWSTLQHNVLQQIRNNLRLYFRMELNTDNTIP